MRLCLNFHKGAVSDSQLIEFRSFSGYTRKERREGMKPKEILPDAPILVESTRSIGYSLESALADIIDNSISKEAKNIDVYFDSDPMYVAVIDDGTGMSMDELCEAMKYGSRSSLEDRNPGDLGRFGLGLKMASLSQCRKLSVATKKDGQLSIAEWDLDFIIETGSWFLRVYDPEDYEGFPCLDLLKDKDSGTIVLWREFDRLEEKASQKERVKTFDEKLDRASMHVALVFHRYLNKEVRGRSITIKFNNQPVEPIDPFMTDNPATQPLEEETACVDGQRIVIKPFVLPYSSKLTAKDKKLQEDYVGDLKLNQGFYIYRNYRLIVWGTWFRLVKYNELKKLTRIRVDIPNSLDSVWGIDIKKSSAELPSSIKKKLRDVATRAGNSSEQVYRYRGRKVTNDKYEHVWEVIEDRGKYSYEINKNLALVKSIEAELSEEGQLSFQCLLRMLEQSFPYTDVYCRHAKNENKEISMEEDEVAMHIRQYIEACKGIGKTSADAYKSACRLDIFAGYKSVLDDLRDDYL